MNTLNSRSSTPRRRGGVRWWVILLFGLYAAWYWFSNQQEAAFTGRAQLIDSSVQEEAALGLQAYREILSQSRVLTQGQAPAQVKQIAERLVAVGPRVENHVQNTMRKLGLRNRVELTRYAIRRGLVEP